MLEQFVSTTPSEVSGNHATELSTIGHVNSEWRWRGTFDFIQLVNNYVLKRRIFCHRFEFVSHFSQELNIQFGKIFHRVLLYNIGSDY